MQDTEKKFTLRELNTTHREIIRLHLLGKKNDEIGPTVGRHPNYVGSVLRDPLAKAHMARLQDRADNQVVDIRKRIQTMAPKALDTMDRLMKFGQDSTAFNAAKDTLDRAGLAPVQKSLNVNVDAVYGEESKARIIKRMKQAEEQGLVVDVEPLPDAPELPTGI